MDLFSILGKLQQEKPGVVESIVIMRKAVAEASALDPKTANLISVGIGTALRNPEVIEGHIKLAREAGAGRDEVISAILQALPSAGVPAVLAAMPLAWEAYEGNE